MIELRTELESDCERRRFGTGWLSGAAAVVLAVIGFGTVLCLHYPDLLAVPDAREFYNSGVIRLALHIALIAAFTLGAVSIVVRETKVLGFSAMTLVLADSRTQEAVNIESDVSFGLDWFLLNLILNGIIFVPLEGLFYQHDQPIFRVEWRKDLFYFFVSSLLVRGLTNLSLAPSLAILKHSSGWSTLRA